MQSSYSALARQTGFCDILTMNYLFRYLISLNDDELALLDTIDLSPRERQTLSTLIEMRSRKEVTKEEAIGRLAMSGTMFDKTCSLLLRKAYDAIAPGGKARRLFDLANRQLSSHFFHEAKLQERSLPKEDNCKRHEFLLSLLEAAHGAAAGAAFRDEIARYVVTIASDHPWTPEQRLALDIYLCSNDIWRALLGGLTAHAAERLLEQLDDLNARAAEHEIDDRTRFRLLYAWVNYYEHVTPDGTPYRHLLEEIIALCPPLPAGSHIDALCRLAEYALNQENSPDEAHRLYRELFSNPDFAGHLASSYYHAVIAFYTALSVGDYPFAERILRQFYGGDLIEAPPEIACTGAAAWAIYHLYVQRFAEAFVALDTARRLNDKLYFIRYEVQIRLLEALAHALNGNLETAEMLASTGVRYAVSKGLTEGDDRFFLDAFKLVVALLDERLAGKPLPKPLRRRLEEMERGAATLYYRLFARLRARKAVEA
jgi:hypothetical protein